MKFLNVLLKCFVEPAKRVFDELKYTLELRLQSSPIILPIILPILLPEDQGSIAHSWRREDYALMLVALVEIRPIIYEIR